MHLELFVSMQVKVRENVLAFPVLSPAVLLSVSKPLLFPLLHDLVQSGGLHQ